MAQLGTVKTHKKLHVGNTRRRRARCWFLTINNYNLKDIEEIMKFEKYMFQEEQGEKKGTVHIQGVIYNKNPIEFNTIKLKFPKAHIEKTRSIKHAVKYCCKPETRIGKTWCKGFKLKKKMKDIIKEKGPLRWQYDVIEMIKKEPDDRKIYWYWGEEGCKGKTILAKHLVMNYGAIAVGGRYQDALRIIMRRRENDEDIDIVIFDIARGDSEPSYNAMEKIKDGLCCSTKYDSDMMCFNPPHVLVFANREPNLDMLSKDRWVVKVV